MAYTTIDKPSDYFETKLYTGNGGTQSITGLDFAPDWVWTKGRSGTYSAESHKLYDTVRGTTKELRSDVSNAESTNSTGVTSFNSDGYALGADGGMNGSSTTYVSWNWKAGGSASSNSNGSITSSVSVNTTSGFSIVSYTGTGSNATVGHGLGVAPSMMIVKQRNSTENWTVYHKSIGNPAQYMELNRTVAVLTNSAVWNSTNPTSSVFSIGTNARTNNNTSTYIAYCFADTGNKFFKAGSYVGNGNADGTFVYTGFKPAFVLLKNANGTYNWNIQDNKRDPYNPVQGHLAPNNSAAEADSSSYYVDFLSNGFKIRNNLAVWNGSGNTLIYMAFAEHPFVTSSGVPATAR